MPSPLLGPSDPLSVLSFAAFSTLASMPESLSSPIMSVYSSTLSSPLLVCVMLVAPHPRGASRDRMTYSPTLAGHIYKVPPAFFVCLYDRAGLE